MNAPGGGAGAAGLLALAALGLMGFGGAAAAPDGTWLGLPGAAGAILTGAGCLILALVAGVRACAPARGLGLVPLLVVCGAAVPGLGALTGPPLLALLLAGLVAVLWQARPQVASWLLFPAVLALYLGVAARVQREVGAEGDEPHYLMVTESLLRDYDLSLEQDYAERRYAPFYRKPRLDPHYRVRGKGGEIYSLHAVGLSLLLLPAYALGGYPGASFQMAFLLAVLVVQIRALVRHATGSATVAEGMAWLVALSPPLIHYAGLVFTEVPAALIVALALSGAWWSGRERAMLRLGGLGSAIAFLPWLNVRYVPVAAVLLAYLIASQRRWRAAVALVAPVLAGGVLLALHHLALYGFLDPRRVYGARPELSLERLPEGLVGLLLDQEFGLLAYAPVFVLSAGGLLLLVGRGPRLAALASLLLVGLTLALSGSWHMWRGGFNPPARFLVPVVPALALGLARALAGGPKAAAALLAGWGLFTGLAGGLEPRLVHRDRDGSAPLLRARSGAEEWTRLLPAYVLADPDRHRLALLWGSALVAAAVPWPIRPLGLGARLAAGSLAFMTASGAASQISDGRTGGRDAVRLVGEPAFLPRRFQAVGSQVARWDASSLGFGPLYEPHRHPAGALIGDRLGLPPGRYRISIGVESLPGAASPPSLRVVPDSDPGSRREAPVSAAPGGLASTFEVFPADLAVSLRLVGGSAFVLRDVALEALKPPGLPPV